MRNARTVLHEILRRIDLDERPDEVRIIASLLLEKVAGLTQSDIMTGKMVELTPVSMQMLDEYVERINRHEPVQYVLGEAFFYGRIFEVGPAVLIPRPETEELVRAALSWEGAEEGQKPARVLDIGTGSGCIAVTLSLAWPDAEIVATDISPEALELARRNAGTHGATIEFIQHDILSQKIPAPEFDVIVSNPPYIGENEKQAMQRNVLDYEPHLALFAAGDDPLIFYRAISDKARDAVNRGGLLIMEINERYGREVCSLLADDHWKSADIVHDIDGKPRVVKAIHK